MKKRGSWLVCLLCAVLIAGLGRAGAQAAFEPEVEAAYNRAVQGQEALDGLDVVVKEKTVAASSNAVARKTIQMQISGIKGTNLKADIAVTTNEEKTESYYRDSYYYSTTSEGKRKREMDRTDVWKIVNSYIYMDLTSNYLKMLSSERNSDGTTTYLFTATQETLGDYSGKFLSGAGDGVEIDSLQGTVVADRDGVILQRNIQLVYSVTQGEKADTFLMQTDVEFRQTGQGVTVSFPDLSDYREKDAEKPAETITPLIRTVYTTADVNVRAAGNISAVILGGLSSGSGVTQTGYTSDGWIQIQYNGATAYVWGDYISETKPVDVKNGSGTMYATADVNIRDNYVWGATILGVLKKGKGIEVTGTLSNGWIRVKYQGMTGYIYSDYLSSSEPVSDSYVTDAYLTGTVTDASYGVLVVQRDDGGGTVTFNTTYAEMDLEDTLHTGDWVEVYYYGSGSPYTASRVNDSMGHDRMAGEEAVNIEGVISSCPPNRLEVLGTDGIYRTFDISNPNMDIPEELYEGKYVVVTWLSKTGGSETRDIEPLRISEFWQLDL